MPEVWGDVPPRRVHILHQRKYEEGAKGVKEHLSVFAKTIPVRGTQVAGEKL